MRQRHNAQLANFDVTSLRVTASARTQEADIAVHFRSRYAAEIPPSEKRFELCAFASRALLRSGEQDNLTRIRLQLAAYLFVGSRAAMHQLVRPWRGSVDGHGIG